MLRSFLKSLHRRTWFFYRRRNRWHFILDISLSLLIVILLVIVLTLNFYRPELLRPPLEPVVEPNGPVEEITDPLEISFSLNKNTLNSSGGVLLDLEYFNNSDRDINNLIISFETLSRGFTVNRLENILLPGEVKIVGRTLVIDELEALGGGQASIRVYVNLSDDPLARETAWQAVINHLFEDQEFKQEIRLNNLKFLSNTKIEATAYYHSSRGDQLGVGPIPPIVDIPTVYWIFFSVENMGNNLENVVISGKLPVYAELGSNQSLLAGDYSYDPANRRLIWQLPFVDKANGNYRAGFEIKINPESEHLGQVLNLITDLTYRFTDTLANEEIRGALRSLNTDLVDDFLNQGQGTVVE